MTDNPVPEHLGRYRVVRELGRGAMGVVYEGQDPQIGRRVAIKTARSELIAGPGASPDALERFFREARVAGMLNHPNIITVYDAGEQDGTAYIAMEYIDGPDLGARMAKGPRYSPQEAVELVATLADALAFAHEHGVVHRDIKPANIMLPRDGPPKLADFGIAHTLDSTLTQEGTLIGTPSYMSPEQFMGQRLDGRSDLFSLATVLYELLTQERPFTGAAFSTVMHHVIKTDPVPPHELNFAVGETLSKVVVKALSKAPQGRQPDGHAFASELRGAIQTQPAAAPVLPAQDATVRMNADEFFTDTAGLPAQNAALLRQTMPGAPPFQENLGSPPADGQQTETDTTTATARRHHGSSFPVLRGVLLLVIAIATGLYLYLHLNQQPGPQPAPLTPVAAITPPTVVLDTPGDPTEHPKLKVSVYATADDGVYLEYQQVLNGQGNTEAYIRDALAAGRIQPLRGAGYSVVVFNPLKLSEPYATESLTEDGYALLQLPENTQKIKFEVHSGTEVLLPVELSASACQDSQTFLVLCPNCVTNTGTSH